MKIIHEENPQALELAVAALRSGKIISFSCDTVYGIAADACNSKAVDGLYKLKNRDQKKPIAIFLQSLDEAKRLFYFDKNSEKLAEQFLPGALTLVLKTRPEAANILASNLNQNGDNFLGFRIIDLPFVKNLLAKFGGVLAVTSANLSNEEAAISADEVKKNLSNSDLELLIDGGISQQKISSTVVKVDDGKVSILRHGAVKITLSNFTSDHA